MKNPFKKSIKIKLIDICGYHISTGQVARYIIHLYHARNLRHIGYDFINVNGSMRIEFYTLPGNKSTIEYFNDRCAGMIEEDILKINTNTPVNFRIENWGNGFSEVIDLGNNNTLRITKK